MVRVAFEAYGCTLSYGESRRARSMAEAAGWETTDNASSAPIVVVHTCTVIGRTERSMLRRIDELAMSGRMVVVAGCLPRAQAEHVEAMEGESVMSVLGQDPADVLEAMGRVDLAALDDPLLLPGVEVHMGSLPDPAERTDAIVPIASGCLGGCTYCITRLAWGPLRSRPMEDVVAEARAWMGEGFREVQLTGQDTGAWGRDLGEGTRLPDLVRAVASIEPAPSEYRVRVGMLNPDSLEPVMEPMVEVLGLPRVYRFVHIPVQSGSDRVLGLMRRRYTARAFEHLVRHLREDLDGLTVHTDVICGFPGEDDEEFEATMDLLRRVRPDVVNVKGFSPRPHTQAASMEDPVDGPVMKRRTRRVSTLAGELVTEGLTAHLGETVDVMVTEVGKPGTGTMMARDIGYNAIVVPANGREGLRVGQVATVHLEEARGVYLVGTLVE